MVGRLRARSQYRGEIAMTKEHSVLGQFFFGGSPSRASREEKVLRYIIHRIDEDAELHEVLEEPYVQRNCSQIEIDEIRSNPELVHACREHLEQTFRSGELDPRRHRPGCYLPHSQDWRLQLRQVLHCDPRLLSVGGGGGFLRLCMAYPALGAILLGSDGAARVFSPSRF